MCLFINIGDKSIDLDSPIPFNATFIYLSLFAPNRVIDKKPVFPACSGSAFLLQRVWCVATHNTPAQQQASMSAQCRRAYTAAGVRFAQAGMRSAQLQYQLAWAQ